MKNLAVNKTLWTVTSLIILIVALGGVVNHAMYSTVMDVSLLPGAMAQDLLTIIIAILLLITILRTRANDVKKQIFIIGVLGSLAYLYAIFSIERVYTMYYLLYLAILGLSLYTIPFSIASLNQSIKWHIPKYLKIASVIFSIFIGILFTFIWTGALIPAMMSGKKIELYYSIYILDLAWVMPGFLITAVLMIKDKTIGFLLSPAIYILGIFVIFPLGLGEIAKLFYGQNADYKSMVMSFLLAGIFFVLTSMHFLMAKNIYSYKKAR